MAKINRNNIWKNKADDPKPIASELLMLLLLEVYNQTGKNPEINGKTKNNASPYSETT